MIITSVYSRIKTPAWYRVHLRCMQRTVSAIANSAAKIGKTCQREACRLSMSGNPPRRRLATKALSASRKQRTIEGCLSRRSVVRGSTIYSLLQDRLVIQPVERPGNLSCKGVALRTIDKVSTVTIAVTDQDEALAWFTQMLGFEKRVDQRGHGFRWLTVAPPPQFEVEFLLASWFPDSVGKNATWVLSTRDCQGGYEELKGKGIEFVQTPQRRPWGIEAVFVDLYGNKYALVQESAQVLTDATERKALRIPDIDAMARKGHLAEVDPA